MLVKGMSGFNLTGAKSCSKKVVVTSTPVLLENVHFSISSHLNPDGWKARHTNDLSFFSTVTEGAEPWFLMSHSISSSLT